MREISVFVLPSREGGGGNKKIKISKDVSLSDLALQSLAQHSLKLVTAAGWSRLHAFFQRLFFFLRSDGDHLFKLCLSSLRYPHGYFTALGTEPGHVKFPYSTLVSSFFRSSFLENVEINTFFR